MTPDLAILQATTQALAAVTLPDTMQRLDFHVESWLGDIIAEGSLPARRLSEIIKSEGWKIDAKQQHLCWITFTNHAGSQLFVER